MSEWLNLIESALVAPGEAYVFSTIEEDDGSLRLDAVKIVNLPTLPALSSLDADHG